MSDESRLGTRIYELSHVANNTIKPAIHLLQAGMGFEDRDKVLERLDNIKNIKDQTISDRVIDDIVSEGEKIDWGSSDELETFHGYVLSFLANI